MCEKKCLHSMSDANQKLSFEINKYVFIFKISSFRSLAYSIFILFNIAITLKKKFRAELLN